MLPSVASGSQVPATTRSRSQAHLPARRVARARTARGEQVDQLEPAAVVVLAQREVQLVGLPLEGEPVRRLPHQDLRRTRVRVVRVATERDPAAGARLVVDLGGGEPVAHLLRVRDRLPDAIDRVVVDPLEAHRRAVVDLEVGAFVSRLHHFSLSRCARVGRGWCSRAGGTAPATRRARPSGPARPHRSVAVPAGRPAPDPPHAARAGASGCGWVRPSRSTSSPTDSSPWASRSSTARRFGSTSAVHRVFSMSPNMPHREYACQAELLTGLTAGWSP